MGYRRRLLPHRPFSKPLRLVSVPHDARMGSYSRQHVLCLEPVDPLRALCCADMLAPAVVRVRADAVDRDDATRKVSLSWGDGVWQQQTYSTISAACAVSAASAGAPRSTFRPMSSSVTGRTWPRVSASTLRSALDPPLPCVMKQRLPKLSNKDLDAKEGVQRADSEAERAE
jgi:hypothetical protein